MQSLRNTILIFILMNSLATFGEDLIPVTGGLFGAKGTEQISNFQGIQSVTAEFGVLAATHTITAPTVIFAASGIPMYVGLVSASDHGKAMIYDATSGAVLLKAITESLDYEGIGASLSVGMLNDVSVEFASEGWVPAWNAASEIWEATPAAEYTPSITESEVATMIQSATESLTPLEIGAIDTATMNTAIEAAVSNATSTLTLDELDNVSLYGKSDGDVIYWDAGAEVWSATPQATGGGSITGVEEAPENGALYVRSNGNWKPMPSYAAPGAYVNPPDLSYFDYEWTDNPASATTEISYTSSYLSVTRTSNSADDLINFIGADVPSATPWTITAIITCRTAGTQYGRHGLALHETSSHKTIFVGNGNNNYVPQVINGKISSAGVWDGQYGTEIRFYGLSTIYTKITFDGTYYYFYYGLDNFGDFTLYNTVLKSDYFSLEADKIGIMISTRGAISVYPYISCSYWDAPDFPAD